MEGVGRAGKAIDAAMFAAAVGVDRAIEPNVRGAVARQNRLGTFDGDGRSPRRNAVDRFDLVQPFTLDHALLEVEARRRGIAGRAAAMLRLDRHRATLNGWRNISRT